MGRLRVAIVGLRLSLPSKSIRAGLPILATALLCLARSATATGMQSGATSEPSEPGASSALRVLVRVDTRVAEKHVRLADLIRSVQAIWKPYAAIVFADTADPRVVGYDDEIELVVSARPGTTATGASALGWITFVPPGQPASFVTVSVATARSLIARSNWMGRPFHQLPLGLSQQFVTRAISWSAAHEIGHYLLRTSGHSTSGLMKGRLTAPEIMWNDRGLVQLEPREVEVLRRRASRADPVTAVLLEAPGVEP
jgi:hypothetical protein